MTLITRLTNVVVDMYIHLGIEPQGEHTGGGKKVASLAPSVAPQAAAIDGTSLVRGWHVVNTSQQTILTAEVEDG